MEEYNDPPVIEYNPYVIMPELNKITGIRTDPEPVADIANARHIVLKCESLMRTLKQFNTKRSHRLAKYLSHLTFELAQDESHGLS